MTRTVLRRHCSPAQPWLAALHRARLAARAGCARPSGGTRVVLLVLAILCGAPSQGNAYPHFQVASGSARCSNCHLTPAGGGLLNAWGREESGDTISGGGNGQFLHGAVTLPASLFIGGNIRLAALANDVGASEGTETAVFPMQADVGVGINPAEAWTIIAFAGLRGRVRSAAPTSNMSEASHVTERSLADYVISREHFVMWRRDEAAGLYVRAGRFSAPYGLRLADHTAYIRRYLGYNLLEETYGLSVGWLGDTIEVHATGFVYDPVQGASREEAGGALLVEGQGDSIVLGGSARASIAPATTRLQAGVFGKKYFASEDVLLQAEADVVRELFDGPGDRWQLAAYAGPVWIAVPGINVGVAYQAFAEDLSVRSVLRQGLDGWLSYLPIAHVEIMVSARGQRIGPHEHAYTGMLQLHYYL